MEQAQYPTAPGTHMGHATGLRAWLYLYHSDRIAERDRSNVTLTFERFLRPAAQVDRDQNLPLLFFLCRRHTTPLSKCQAV